MIGSTLTLGLAHHRMQFIRKKPPKVDLALRGEVDLVVADFERIAIDKLRAVLLRLTHQRREGELLLRLPGTQPTAHEEQVRRLQVFSCRLNPGLKIRGIRLGIGH